jgi:hypothetical protein
MPFFIKCFGQHFYNINALQSLVNAKIELIACIVISKLKIIKILTETCSGRNRQDVNFYNEVVRHHIYFICNILPKLSQIRIIYIVFLMSKIKDV